MFIEIIKFIIYSSLIVIISKYILVKTLRKLAESLNLKAKIIGDISGYATSVPEFLTIITSSLSGLYSTGIYNILSSNIINLVQYMSSIIFNKNLSKIKNKAIKINLILVGFTIIIPLILVVHKIDLNLWFAAVFIVIYMFFKFINSNVHKLYLEKEDKQIEKIIKMEKRWKKGKISKTIKYAIILLFAGILLFFIGKLLGDAIEKLCKLFNVSEIIVGILLGLITSIPELITFFESQKHHKDKENDMLGVVESTNNLLTSNMINLFIIQTIGIILLKVVQ